MPHPSYNWAHYVPSIGAYIASKDTVLIRGDDGVFSFVGRVLSVCPYSAALASADTNFSVHPTAASELLDENAPVFLIQLYAEKSPHIPTHWNNTWPHLERELLKATTGLVQVAITNALVWCCASQIEDLVFFPHSEECKNHTFGPMNGRKNHYFVNVKAVLEQDGSANFLHVDLDEYRQLGHTSTNPGHATTYTERITQCLYTIIKHSTKLINKERKLSSTTSTRFPLLSEGYTYLLKNLSSYSDITHGSRKTRTKQPIYHTDLSLESKRLPTLKHFITASSRESLRVLRSVLPGCGTGVKKRVPPALSTHNNTETLSNMDTIFICDVNTTDFNADSDANFVNGDISVFERRNNEVKLMFDTRLVECRISMRCLPLRMNAIANTHIEDYLKSQSINWSVIGQGMHPGSNVLYEEVNYVIRSISGDSAVLLDEVENTTITVPLNECSLL